MSSRRAELPDLDGRTFCSAANSSVGEVDSATVFQYHQQRDEIWAEYSGGAVRRGFLVGLRGGDRLDFRYAHLNVDGRTSAGHCLSTITSDNDGRLVLNEAWEWESRPGQGTSTLIELP